jgi:YegS/Rv2252/BmrU family lipid kinase
MHDLFVFIVNARIGGKRIAELTQAIQYTFGVNGYKIFQTEYGGHAKDLAIQLVNEGIQNIVAVGGDGTVNEIIQVLAKKNITLGIIPTGSGNGLARHCKIPLKMNEAVALLKTGKRTLIDLGKINDVYFISNAGVGFDAVVCNAIKQTKSRGLKMYVRKVIQHYFRYKADTYTIHIDGREFKQKAFFMNVANGKEFGYGFEIAPNATLQDGMLDMIIVKSINPLNGFSEYNDLSKSIEGDKSRTNYVKFINNYFDLIYDAQFKIKFIKFKDNTQQINSYAKDKLIDFLKVVFKYMCIQKKQFRDNFKILVGKGDGLDKTIAKQNTNIISNDGLRMALFMNGRDLNVNDDNLFNKFYESMISRQSEPIYLINNEMCKTIFENFIRKISNYIYTDSKDSSGKQVEGVPIKWINSFDTNNFENIFSIKLYPNSTDSPSSQQKQDAKLKLRNTEINDINDDKIGKTFNINRAHFNSAIVNYNLLNLITNTTTEPKNYTQNISFSNSLVKYIYIIINYLYNIISNTQDKPLPFYLGEIHKHLFYRASVFFIYKYINFICNQGKAIVTSLEHLKYFFLYRTNGLNNYNYKVYTDAEKIIDANEKEEYLKKQFRLKSQDDSTQSQNIVSGSMTYSYKTNITNDIKLTEVVDYGYMKDYGLVEILEELSSNRKIDLNDVKSNDTESIDYYSKTSSKVANVKRLKLSSDAENKCIFVMLTNIKGETDTADKSLLCDAAYDTLEFAQSISSTTFGSSSITTQKGGMIKYFNKKELKRLGNRKNVKLHKYNTLKNMSVSNANKKKNIFSRKSKKSTS